MAGAQRSSGEHERRGDLQQLILRIESVVDDVLKPQVQQIQQRQERIFEELIEVQTLADHIELLQLQGQHRLEERSRVLRRLRELHVLREASEQDDRTAPLTPSSESSEERGEDVDAVPVDALVDVGCHVYVKATGYGKSNDTWNFTKTSANWDDIRRILVNIGFQFYLDMTLDEAAEFLHKKELLLTKKYEFWSLRSAGVKAQIHLLLQSVSALIQEPALQLLPFGEAD